MKRFLQYGIILAVACGPNGTSDRTETVVRLQRQIDSLKSVIDSLRRENTTAATTGANAPSSSSDQSSQPTVFSSGNWAVHRSVDPMTDKPTCTGIYHNDWNYQLNEKAFYISVRGRGGVKAVRLRFGDSPAQGLRLASETEGEVSAVIVAGTDFSSFLKSPRLRAEIATVLDNAINEDLDLTGVSDVHNFMSTSPQCRS